MKSLIKYINLTVVALLMAGCYNDPGNEIVFSADSQLEWDEGDSGSQALYERVDNGAYVMDNLVVNLVGPQAKQAINFTISIDPLSTAVEGVHFDLPEGTSFSIAAGESSVNVPIEILDDNIEVGESLQLVLNISSADIKISPNYLQIIHTFSVICPSNIALGTYNAVSNASSTDGCPPTNPLVDFASTIELTSAGVGEYRVSDFFAGVYINWYGACYGYTFATPASFTDNCSTLSFSFTDAFGATVQGTGSYDPDTEIITYHWVNDFDDEGTVTLTKQ